jgi:hypothetical protein
MTRKLLGRAVAAFALTAGLVVLAAQVSAGDQTAPVPVEPQPADGVVAKTDAEGTVDMNNWQQTQGSSSKFRPARR